MKVNKRAYSGLFLLFAIAVMISIASIDPSLSKLMGTLLPWINHFKNDQVAQESRIVNHKKDVPYSKEIINQILQQRYMATMNHQADIKSNGQDPDSQEMIEEALNALNNNDNDELDRELAVMTLGEFTSNKARQGILFALNDPSAIVREQAISQISEWEDMDERQKMILSALNSKNTETIIWVLESISHVDNHLLIKRLKALSKSKNKQIREAAKLALEFAE